MRTSGTVFGYSLEADVPLARARSGPAPRGRIVVERSARPSLDRVGELLQWSEERDTGEPYFVVARTGRELIAWCAATGTYQLDPARGRVWSDRRGSREEWEDRVINSILPLLLLARGDLVLHASAVLSDEGAIILCGPCGRGKSTLAAVLDAQGLPVLAEDGIVVTFTETGALAWPGPVGVRLDPVTTARLNTSVAGGRLMRGKLVHRPRAERTTADAVPVAAVVTLDPRTARPAPIQPLAPAAGLATLVPSVFRLDVNGLSEAVAQAAELVRRVPVFRVEMLDDLRHAPAAASELVAGVTRPPARRTPALSRV
jgi:hypothetical protein